MNDHEFKGILTEFELARNHNVRIYHSVQGEPAESAPEPVRPGMDFLI